MEHRDVPDAPESPAHEKPERAPSKWRGRLAVLGALVIAIGIWHVWFGPPPDVPEKPVRFQRGPDGKIAPVDEDDAPNGGHLEFHAGELRAKNNMSSTTSSTRSGSARFACRRIHVYNESDHLLMGLVGVRLAERLGELRYVEEIDYYPLGHRPEPGGLAPDVIVRLDLARIDESGFPPTHQLDATVLLTAGTRYAKCRAGYVDNLTAPVVDFMFNGKLEHSSTRTGISSSSAKYKQVSQNIAEELVKALTAKFEEFHEKDGPLPDLPAAFYPPYRTPEALPVMGAFELEPLVSHHGFLFPSESFWRLSTTRGVDEILTEIELIMKEAGWRTSELETHEKNIPRLRMKRDDDVFLVFPEEDDEAEHHEPMSTGSPPEEEAALEENRFLVYHLDRMSREDLRHGVDELLAAGAPLDTILLFEGSLEDEQWDHLMVRLEAGPPKTLEAWTVLAGRYHQRKNEERARDALLRASVLLRTVQDPGSRKSRLDRIAKDLGIERWDTRPIAPEILRELGFIELHPGESVPAHEVALDEPVHFHGVDEKGKLHTVSVRVVREDGGGETPSYSLLYVQAHEGMRSWGKGGLSCSTRFGKALTARFAAKPIGVEGEERFRLEVDLSE